MLTFETERLVMRPWRESDAEDFHYAQNPHRRTCRGLKPAESFEESFKTLQEFCKNRTRSARSC